MEICAVKPSRKNTLATGWSVLPPWVLPHESHPQLRTTQCLFGKCIVINVDDQHTHTTLQEKQCPSHSWTPLCSGSSFTSTCGEKHVPARHNRATSARWPYGKNRWKFTDWPWWTRQGTQRRYWTSPSKICSTVVPMTTRLEALRSLRSAMKEIQYRRGFPGGHTSPWAESTNGWKFFWSPSPWKLIYLPATFSQIRSWNQIPISKRSYW